MGNFWDVPGRGKATEGARKKLALWGLHYKFQRRPKNDRRYKFIPAWEINSKKPSDYGYYYIQSGTGYFVQPSQQRRGTQLWLNGSRHSYPNSYSYHWKIRNIGRNKFVITNRSNNIAIDAAGGHGSRKGTKLISWTTNNGTAQQWQFILINEDRERKSTKRMIKKRAQGIARGTKKFTKKAFNQISRKFSKAVIQGVHTVPLEHWQKA